MRPLHVLASAMALAACLTFADAPASAIEAEMAIDGVPIPKSALVQVPPINVPPHMARFSGTWTGSWNDTLKHMLIVESITASGDASVIYALGDNSMLGVGAQWHRFTGKIDDGILTVTGPTAKITYEVTGTGRLRALYDTPNLRGDAVMTSANIATLKATNGSGVTWSAGTREWLTTGQSEAGKPVRLQAIVSAPPGTGPFPLALFTHGAAGDGTNAANFKQSWSPSLLAEVLNERGYIVAFLQRRGRGGSEGTYDEGFEADRKLGYSCDATRTLAGAERALDDIDVAVRALRRRPDVAGGRILIGGQSRGGALAIAYAGQRGDQVAGVINVVGGWVGIDCPNAAAVNAKLFGRGGSFNGHTLWLYGQRDPFYPMAHSRANFSSFEKAGGHGTFVETPVSGTGNPGHAVIGDPSAWEAPFATYLDQITDRTSTSSTPTMPGKQ